MKRKLFILGIIAMFFVMALVSSGASITTEQTLEKSNTKKDNSWEGKWFIVTVRNKENFRTVPGADVEIWDVPQKNAGVLCQGKTNLLGKFSTKDMTHFEHQATVVIHAEAIIDGERKVYREQMRSSSSGPLHKTVYLDEPQGKSKEISNLFESQLLQSFFSNFPRLLVLKSLN
jgi:hypothetical protein